MPIPYKRKNNRENHAPHRTARDTHQLGSLHRVPGTLRRVYKKCFHMDKLHRLPT